MSGDTHAREVPAGMTCRASYEDIDKDSYVEYQSYPSGVWRACEYSQPTVEYLLANGYKMYMKDFEKASTDCAAAVRRIIGNGPPVYLSDLNHADAMPLEAGEVRVDKFWFMSNNSTVTGKLEGSLEGEEREKKWQEQKALLAAMEVADAAEAAEKKA